MRGILEISFQTLVYNFLGYILNMDLGEIGQMFTAVAVGFLGPGCGANVAVTVMVRLLTHCPFIAQKQSDGLDRILNAIGAIELKHIVVQGATKYADCELRLKAYKRMAMILL